MLFRIPVTYHGQTSFIVEADNSTEAKRIAIEKWLDGDVEMTVLADDFEDVDNVGEPTSVLAREKEPNED